LREALVRAALALIGDKGPGGFTFADAAGLAGVSPAARYRHFRDREQLLCDVARRGFEHAGFSVLREASEQLCTSSRAAPGRATPAPDSQV
jgi:AcrR family transcriptional regulator